MSWQWQNAYLWQSCTDAAKARAKAVDSDRLIKDTATLAALQPLVTLADDTAALAAIRNEAAALRQVSERLVVVGTGGSTLGANTLCAIATDPSRVRFLENCDPVTLNAFLRLERETTGWCIISKSGETLETVATALTLTEHYRGLEKSLARQVRVITAVPDSSLGQLAKAQGWQVLPHPPGLGGRFSVFSVVGLLPAAYAGIDIVAVTNAARDMFGQVLAGKDDIFAGHAAWIYANMSEKPMQLLMAYADRLRPATRWYRQLWAESLGKDGKGGTPITAIGAIDQHSQLQLYLGGPRDKLVTLWLPDAVREGRTLPMATVAGLRYLSGHTMGDVMRAAGEATVTTLAKAGVPMRVLRGPLSPASLAEYLARQMLETLAVGVLLGIDPYSQPAVEEGKKLARASLAETQGVA